MLWRLYISGDTIKKSDVSDSEDNNVQNMNGKYKGRDWNGKIQI